MKTTSRSSIHVDLIPTQTHVAELAKLAMAMKYQLQLLPSEHGIGMAATLTSEETWVRTELAAMAAVESLAHDLPVDRVLELVRNQLEAWHFPTEGKPSDNRGIGEGHA